MKYEFIAGIPADEWHKKYYINNLEKFNKYQKEYYQKNAEKFKQSSKKYYEANRETVIELNRVYLEKHSDRMKEYSRNYSMTSYHANKVNCSCGKIVAKKNFEAHLKTNIHTKTLTQLSTTNQLVEFSI